MHINRFLDKMAVVESKQNKDVVLPISDARGLRDDITRLLSELVELQKQKGVDNSQEVIQVEIKGGTFK
jgi:undecaprenyl pyrophosphate synthase